MEIQINTNSFPATIRNCSETISDKNFKMNSIGSVVAMDHLALELYNSSFHENLSLEDVKNVINSWSIGMSVKKTTSRLKINKELCEKIYSLCASYSKTFATPSNCYKFGEKNSILIIDIYPNGCKKFGYQHNSKETLLCIAEVKNTPPRYHFEPIEFQDKSNERDQSILWTIQKTISPNVTLIIDVQEFYQYDSVKILEDAGIKVVSLDSLKNHDTPEQSVMNNLRTIWTPAIRLFDESAC